MSQSPLQPVSSTPAEEQSASLNPEAATAQTALLESPELASPFTQGADSLMNDLFGELEQALARESVLPNSPQTAEWIAPPPEMPAPPIADPVGIGALMPRLTPRQLVPGEVEPDPDVMLAVNPSTQTAPKSRSFDKLLLATLCASLLTTGLLWLWFRDGSRFPRLNNPQPSPAAQTPPPTPEQIEAAQQQQFLTYVDRSLDRIEQSTQENRLAQQNSPDKPAATPPQTVLERVYVPVYQPPQVIAAQPNVVIQQPTVPGSTPGNSSATPAPAPAPATNVPNIAAASSYKLVGVLELGDRSAALFEVNGNPRRIQVGEPIGDSGWTLVSVANQEALVRRNGEVRSIYVGQQF